MEEISAPQHAIQIAFYTLRDRCRNLQQRVVLLGEENVNLRIQCSRHEESKNSFNELDYLRAQVAELSEQKGQLQNKVNLVTKENQDLWGKLGQLTRVNRSLGTQLTKINDTISQHSVNPNSPVNQSNLIRSKTFTKNELQTKVLQKKLEENDKISLELEDISLKLSDSFTRQKHEIDLLCSEITEMTFTCDGMNTESCAFLLDEELEDDVLGEIQIFASDFKILRDVVVQQQTILIESLKNLDRLKEKLKQNNSQNSQPKLEKSTSTVDLQPKSFEDKCTETDIEKNRLQGSPSKRNKDLKQCSETICPICSKIFEDTVDFSVFQKHVEDHFSLDSYEML